MNENWVKWTPLDNLKTHYYLVSVIDNMQGFEVMVRPVNSAEDKTVKIYFENSVQVYRRIDESYAGGIGPVNEDTKENFTPWCFFKVENSEYMKWFVKTSIGMVEIWGRSFTHFSILAVDSTLDIIADSEPVVEFID